MRDLPPGTQVMILDEKYLKGVPRPNTEPKYIGKYVIVRREVNGPYVVKDMDGEVLARKVPIDQMKVLFRPGLIPAMQDDEDVYVVDYIVNHRKVKDTNEYEYQVKWKGYSLKDTTWEPAEYIHDKHLIDVYWRKYEGKRQVGRQRKRNVYANMLSLVVKPRMTLFDEADHRARTHEPEW